MDEFIVPVWVVGAFVLFFIAGAYRNYTKTEWDDFGVLLIIVWPISFVILIFALAFKLFIVAGEWFGTWLKSRAIDRGEG